MADWATARAQFQADARAEFGAEQRRGSSSVTAAAPGLGEMPWFSFHDFALSAESTAQVNLANGNLLVKAQDLAIAGPGYSLRHDRFYNSQSTEYGSLGLGWGSNNGAYDSGLTIDSGGVTFRGPNGVELHFPRVGTSTSFTSPAGFNMTLTENTSSVSARYVITHNKSGENSIHPATSPARTTGTASGRHSREVTRSRQRLTQAVDPSTSTTSSSTSETS